MSQAQYGSPGCTCGSCVAQRVMAAQAQPEFCERAWTAEPQHYVCTLTKGHDGPCVGDGSLARLGRPPRVVSLWETA